MELGGGEIPFLPSCSPEKALGSKLELRPVFPAPHRLPPGGLKAIFRGLQGQHQLHNIKVPSPFPQEDHGHSPRLQSHTVVHGSRVQERKQLPRDCP